jgi:hypothetical protein
MATPTSFRGANSEMRNRGAARGSGIPVHRGKGFTLTCWRLGWRERLAALVFGRLWLVVRHGNDQHPPVQLTAAQTVFNRQQQEDSDGDR